VRITCLSLKVALEHSAVGAIKMGESGVISELNRLAEFLSRSESESGKKATEVIILATSVILDLERNLSNAESELRTEKSEALDMQCNLISATEKLTELGYKRCDSIECNCGSYHKVDPDYSGINILELSSQNLEVNGNVFRNSKDHPITKEMAIDAISYLEREFDLKVVK